MNRSLRIIVFATLLVSVVSSFLSELASDYSGSFMTAHIFLFNLTSGGILIIAGLSGSRALGLKESAFYLLCLVFAAGAFFEISAASIAAAALLGALVESVRWKKFSWFPFDFFRPVPVWKKFEQAALLCLSLGLIICAATLANNHYLRLFNLPKLDLHVFFLGFSFPISLANFSLITRRIEESEKGARRGLTEFVFWSLNLGVISFFFFIIFEIYVLQLAASATLFASVVVVATLHFLRSEKNALWELEVSALFFLFVGAATGIAYIAKLMLDPQYVRGFTMSLHAAATLFGWNLSWMLLAVREHEYPLASPPALRIGLHWIFVALLAAGRIIPAMAALSVVPFLALAGLTFFGPAREQNRPLKE